MRKDRRVVFINKWFRRGAGAQDPFDRFFSLWIALIVAAQRSRTEQGSDGALSDDTDRVKVLEYIRNHSTEALQALHESRDSLAKLAERQGARHGNAIVDTGNPELRHEFGRLSAHYLGRAQLQAGELLHAIAALLNKIRNNVFRGVKVYDDRADLELLEMINPVLERILKRCEHL